MTLTQQAYKSLRAQSRGAVWLPGDDGFEHVRRPWNLAIEQSPRAVVEAADTGDISALLRFATAEGIPVATQPSGHGATGRANGAILLRTGRLDSIEVDQSSRTVKVGAGARSGELQREAARYGLTALPGSNPAVSVIGAALGGGLSWFSRSFGWVADSVVGAEVVLAGGTIRAVDDTDPELLWALRGGGGEIAIVTTLTLRLHPAPLVYGGRLLWPAMHRRAVAEVYRSMTETAPPELTLWLELLNFPGAEPMVAIDCTFLGAERDGRGLVNDIARLPAPISDTRAVLSAAELGSITAEPTEPSPGLSRGELMSSLDDDALDALLGEPISPLMSVQIRHLGGALADASDSPHGPLDAPYCAYLFGVPSTVDSADSIAAKQAALVDGLSVTGRKPINFLNPTEGLGDALPTGSLRRLRTLKDRYDPADIIRGNFPLPA